MSNYTKTTNFGAKDTLPPGDSQKIIRGTEFDTEFNNIATAVATKLEVDGSNNLVLAGTASATKFIPTGGTASGNGLYLPTANTLALSTNGVERVRLDSSGNLLVGTATGFTTTGAAGSVAVTGHGIYPYTTYSGSSPSGLVNTINREPLVIASSASFDGSSSISYQGIGSYPAVSATGTGGTNATALYGFSAWPQVPSSGASARLSVGGIIGRAIRASSSDASSNASNAIVGVFSAAGIEGTVSSGASATEIIGFTSTAYSGSGTSTQVYGYRSSVEATSVGTDQNTTITNVAAYAVSRIRLGLTSGATSTVTNLYGVNITGVDVRATATVNNYYAFFAAAPTVTGTLTNRWGVYIADASSPNYFAGSVQVGAGTAAAPTLTTIADTNTGVFFPAADVVGVSTGGTERLRVDAAGNLGLGVTPSAWGNTYKVSQIGAGGGLWGRTTTTTQVGITSNVYNDNSVERYIGSNFAAEYLQASGAHYWYTAPSGTAGNAITFTQAMTLDASGNLTVGNVKLETGSGFGGINTVGATPLLFYTNNTERARVKSTGQVRFVPLSADPAGAESGDVYYNSTSNKLKVYNGTAWVDLH